MQKKFKNNYLKNNSYKKISNLVNIFKINI
jgi:hypothetical protein